MIHLEQRLVDFEQKVDFVSRYRQSGGNLVWALPMFKHPDSLRAAREIHSGRRLLQPRRLLFGMINAGPNTGQCRPQPRYLGFKDLLTAYPTELLEGNYCS